MKAKTAFSVAFSGALYVFGAHTADSNRDGKISLDEFLALKIQQTQESGRTYNEAVQKKIFIQKDVNQDGFLSFDELREKPTKGTIG